MDADDDAPIDDKPPFWIRNLRLWNYKSVGFCDVALEPLSVFVGRNGAGKSNVLDALAMCGELARRDARDAVADRGGAAALARRGGPGWLAVEIVAECAGEAVGYGFRLDANQSWREGFSEWVTRPGTGASVRLAADGSLSGLSEWANVVATPGRGLLASLGDPIAASLREGLTRVRQYRIVPDSLRRPVPPGAGGLLASDGSNAATVLRHLMESGDWRYGRFRQFVNVVVRQVEAVRPTRDAAGNDVLEFDWVEDGGANTFLAAQMSDGTLMGVGVLLAALQGAGPAGEPSVVILEEPEAGLHPGAMEVVIAALDEAALRVQILLTTHSGRALDTREVSPRNVRVVTNVGRGTEVGTLDNVSLHALARHHDTLGGFSDTGFLRPNEDDLDRQAALATQAVGMP